MHERICAPVRLFFAELRPRVRRTMRQFAEEEIILPNGPRENLRFSCAFMPWTGLVLDVFQSGKYRKFFLSGPAQSGKTLVGFVIPTIYQLFEMEDDVIIGVPDIGMAQGIYSEKILPIIQKSRFADQLPVSGEGSRGGKFQKIEFRNGAVLRFMGAGGGDGQRSSHTAPMVAMTEVDKMDEAGQASKEADPVTQIETRTQAFGTRGRVFGECTVSYQTGRINQEANVLGTGSRLFVRCPHCGDYITLVRENFIGWQAARDVIEASEKSGYSCQECGTVWSEEDRQAAIARPVLAAKNQTVDREGKLIGEDPKTMTFGFTFNALYAGMMSMGYIAEKEFVAEHSDRDEPKKAVYQFIWAIPWKDGDDSNISLDRKMILDKICKFPRGVLPDDSARLTVFIDLGLNLCWWSAWAWKTTGEGYCIDYGSIEVPQERQKDYHKVLPAIRTFRDDVLEIGWPRLADFLADKNDIKRYVKPDLVLIDSGWKPEIAYEFVFESGQGRYLASKGFGSGFRQTPFSMPKSDKDKTVGHEWILTKQANGIRLVNLNSDHWKREIHQGFMAPPGAMGSLSIFSADPNEHIGFAKQILAEREEDYFERGKGTRKVWNIIAASNHYLDTASGARAAADMLGISTAAKRPKPVRASQPRPEGIENDSQSQSGIRTKY